MSETLSFFSASLARGKSNASVTEQQTFSKLNSSSQNTLSVQVKKGREMSECAATR